MVTPLGPGDGLQPDAVLRGASQLSHAIRRCCRAQHHLLGQHRQTVNENPTQGGSLRVGGLRTLITPSVEEKVRV